jgi:hypothetical protein
VGGFEEIGEVTGGLQCEYLAACWTYDAAFLLASTGGHAADQAFAPEALKLGMDALAGDPPHLSLTNHAHEAVLQRLLPLGVPLLVAGGGGYHVENTVRGWALAWKVCAGEDEEHDLSLGLGGVMLASSDWAGGLRDHELPVTAAQQQAVDPALRLSIDAVRRNVFPHHGLHSANPSPSRRCSGEPQEIHTATTLTQPTWDPHDQTSQDHSTSSCSRRTAPFRFRRWCSAPINAGNTQKMIVQ